MSQFLVVDTDVVSYIFNWHPSAPRYAEILRVNNPVLSFMTLAEVRFGALQAGWGRRKKEVLEQYLGDFPVCYPDDQLCAQWAEVKHESNRKGRPMSAPDAWIAATGLYLHAPLLTNNVADYEHLADLEIYRSDQAAD